MSSESTGREKSGTFFDGSDDDGISRLASIACTISSNRMPCSGKIMMFFTSGATFLISQSFLLRASMSSVPSLLRGMRSSTGENGTFLSAGSPEAFTMKPDRRTSKLTSTPLPVETSPVDSAGTAAFSVLSCRNVTVASRKKSMLASTSTRAARSTSLSSW